MLFFQGAIGQVIQGRLSEEEKKKRAIRAVESKEIVLGFTRRELGVIAIGAVIIGVLFFFAARTPFDLTTVVLYVVMGGVALCAHEIAHWYLNRKYECSTEVQFWGLGSLIMFLTAWLLAMYLPSQPSPQSAAGYRWKSGVSGSLCCRARSFRS